MHALASGATAGALFTDEVRCPVHVADLAAALLELAASPSAGICHVAGVDAISRYELGLLIAARDGLDQAGLPVGLRTAGGLPGAIDARLDSASTQARLATRLRGAREFLAPTSARQSAGPAHTARSAAHPGSSRACIRNPAQHGSGPPA